LINLTLMFDAMTIRDTRLFGAIVFVRPFFKVAIFGVACCVAGPF